MLGACGGLNAPFSALQKETHHNMAWNKRSCHQVQGVLIDRGFLHIPSKRCIKGIDRVFGVSE